MKNNKTKLVVSDTDSDNYTIDVSGLFHWNSSIEKEIKLKMIEWYNNLSSEERQYVEDLSMKQL